MFSDQSIANNLLIVKIGQYVICIILFFSFCVVTKYELLMKL